MSFILLYLALAYGTWICYLAVMNLMAARSLGTLGKAAYAFGLPLLVVGLAADFLLNMASSVLFLELPHEFLLTARCDRHIHEKTGWRRALAVWICANLLDPFQHGGHCH
ncbi:MAG: hypothetical protein ABFC67_14575 [Mizugakiibacter sp.]|uniref:hypothetical protein n=1 Tax=Mizugakiibacter sp. TaxID=1972610 RepID=UPI00321011C7